MSVLVLYTSIGCMNHDLQHVTYQSSAAEKAEALKFSSGDHLWASQSRLIKPWGQETYGLASVFDGDRCLGTTAYTIGPRGQGILSQVFTDPAYRRQGIGRITLEATIQAYRQEGALAVYLAAWKPFTREFYQSVGFQLVGRMGERYAYKLTLDPAGEEECLFALGQQAELRSLAADDQGDLSSLFNASPASIKSYELGCFTGSHFEGEFYTIRQREDVETIVLDGVETILGFGTIFPQQRRHQTHCGVLDVVIHPSYSDHYAEMVEALQARTPLDQVIAYVIPEDTERCQVLERLGYRSIGRVTDGIRIGSEGMDLTMYEKNLNT